MKLIRSVAMWMVWNVKLGRFAPIVLAFALNSKPHFVGYANSNKETNNGANGVRR